MLFEPTQFFISCENTTGHIRDYCYHKVGDGILLQSNSITDLSYAALANLKCIVLGQNIISELLIAPNYSLPSLLTMKQDLTDAV